jgi:hypothetical protein
MLGNLFCFPLELLNFVTLFIVRYFKNTKEQNVSETESVSVRYGVSPAVTMKNAVFWDVAPCRSCLNRRLEERIASIFTVEKSASDKPA